MAFEFGPFRLDEPGRVLWLAEREVPLQPRVFDLLAYLIRSRERVVSKDELLDALWPGVTVTENSLQRAVSSLRSALREGSMEDAIRVYPRNGYRFCVAADGEKPEQAAAVRTILSKRSSPCRAASCGRSNAGTMSSLCMPTPALTRLWRPKTSIAGPQRCSAWAGRPPPFRCWFVPSRRIPRPAPTIRPLPPP